MPRSKPSPEPLCAAEPVALNEREESPRYRKHHIENPTWPQVEAAIRRLDNAKFNEVSLDFSEGADLTSLMVSGGNEDRVICCVARPDDPAWDQDFRHLVDHAWRDGEFEQVIGGQGSVLPAYLSVPRKLALQAAKYFFEKRALDPALKWEIP